MKDPSENKEPQGGLTADFEREQARQRGPKIVMVYVFFALVETALILHVILDDNLHPGLHFLFRACCFQGMLIGAFLEYRRGLPSRDRPPTQGDGTWSYVTHLINAVLILLFALLFAPTTFRW